jgi:hypothetical protein
VGGNDPPAARLLTNLLTNTHWSLKACRWRAAREPGRSRLVSNRETENFAIEYVLQLERAAGREPLDTRKTGDPVDITSPPRLIEVKAFGGSARGQPVPLEQRQVDALRANPESFFLYEVEEINEARAGLGKPSVLVLDGAKVLAMVATAKPVTTYWPTLRVADYNSAPRLIGRSNGVRAPRRRYPIKDELQPS